MGQIITMLAAMLYEAAEAELYWTVSVNEDGQLVFIDEDDYSVRATLESNEEVFSSIAEEVKENGWEATKLKYLN